MIDVRNPLSWTGRNDGRRLIALLCAALVAACATAEGERGGEGSLAWRTRLLADAVEVELDDRRTDRRVERVALRAPDGTTIAARETTRTVFRGRDAASPDVGVGGSVGSRGGGGVGVGITVPLFGSGARPPAARTTALVPIPDPAAYRADPAAWTIIVTFSERDGSTRHAELPAPVPER